MAKQHFRSDTAVWRELFLEAGEQAVINGALLSADSPVRLRVGSGASVLRGRIRSNETPATAAPRELYYETMLLSSRGMPLASERDRLFELLGRCVMQARSRDAQSICSAYAAAILSGRDEAALSAAHRLTDSAGCEPSGVWNFTVPHRSTTTLSADQGKPLS